MNAHPHHSPRPMCTGIRVALALALLLVGSTSVARAQFGLPTGACCNQVTGACSIKNFFLCSGGGGNYRGDGTTCSPTRCPKGACCDRFSFACVIRGPLGCLSPTQLYQPGRVCSPNPCPALLMGACCDVVSGACQVRKHQDCLLGNYLGDNTTCNPNRCPQPHRGACCDASSGACSIKSFLDCSTSGRSYHGDDSVCSAQECGQGACCDRQFHTCTPSTQPACGIHAWQGVGSTCSPSPCH